MVYTMFPRAVRSIRWVVSVASRVPGIGPSPRFGKRLAFIAGTALVVARCDSGLGRGFGVIGVEFVLDEDRPGPPDDIGLRLTHGKFEQLVDRLAPLHARFTGGSNACRLFQPR